MERFIVNQQMLAHALAIDPVHLSRIKNAKKWTKRQAERVEELTGIPQIELYTLRKDTLNNRLRAFFNDQKTLKRAAQISATK